MQKRLRKLAAMLTVGPMLELSGTQDTWLQSCRSVAENGMQVSSLSARQFGQE